MAEDIIVVRGTAVGRITTFDGGYPGGTNGPRRYRAGPRRFRQGKPASNRQRQRKDVVWVLMG